VSDDVSIYVEGRLEIGRNVYFGRQTVISCLDSVRIGNDVRFAERVSIHDENHQFEPFPVLGPNRSAYVTKPVCIGDRVWVGANVVILSGASIGSDVVIGAGSVVKGNIPAGTLAAGVPAKVIRNLREYEEV
jgi:acetyltransferase-like isoleucine patch superfamily enzyme